MRNSINGVVSSVGLTIRQLERLKPLLHNSPNVRTFKQRNGSSVELRHFSSSFWSRKEPSSESPLSSVSLLEVEDGELYTLEHGQHENVSSSSNRVSVGSSIGGKKRARSYNFCADTITLPGVCEGTTNFVEHMDVFVACRNPLHALGIFHEDEIDFVRDENINNGICEKGNDSVVHQASGYHAIPQSCEYCGSHSIDLCNEKCGRPQSFFARETPPFRCSSKEWFKMGSKTKS